MKALRNLGLLMIWLAALSTPAPAYAAPHNQTFTVTSSLDDVDASPGNGVCANATGQCTLRAAVMEANSTIASDVIILPAATFQLTLSGADENFAATGDLDIYNTLTLSGAGADTTILEANLNDRVFHILPAAVVTLSGVTIRNGNIAQAAASHFGGGIYNQGTFTLSNAAVRANIADYGAGIYNSGVFTLDTSTVSSNIGPYGGAIYNSGSFTVNASAITGNHQGPTDSGQGGGILNDQSGTFLLNNSMVSTNHSAAGGGIANAGIMTVDHTLISENISANFGGGVYLMSGPLNLNASEIRANQAAGSGGGVFIDQGVSPLSLKVVNSTVAKNVASGNGGGLVVIGSPTLSNIVLINTTFSGNSAVQAGGGIYIAGGTVNGYNLTIASNWANADGAGNYTGGGISHVLGAVNLRNSILAQNIHQSGLFTFSDDCSGAFGQFIYSLVGTKTTNCTFTNSSTLIDVNPLLKLLANNGGPTPTMALQGASPAIDAGDPNGCKDEILAALSTDQRGFPRAFDGNADGVKRCDMGAYEAGNLVFIPVVWR